MLVTLALGSEAADLGGQGHLQLHSVFEFILSCIRPFIQRETNPKNTRLIQDQFQSVKQIASTHKFIFGEYYINFIP